jgi:hypothetical protein
MPGAKGEGISRDQSSPDRGTPARQAVKRAEVNGETTGGGAHPTRVYPVSPAVCFGIPFARSVSPATGLNWQGTGVVPDVAVAAEQVCDVAYVKALRHILALNDVPPPILDEAREALASRPAAVSPAPPRG